MSTIYERIEELARNEGFSSINKFALEGLGWNSSQKLQRLKNPKNSPSVDIIIEIADKFDVDLNYLIKGSKLSKIQNEDEIDELENKILKKVLDKIKPGLEEILKMQINNGLILDEVKSFLEIHFQSEKS